MMEDEERPLGDKKIQERPQAKAKQAAGTAARAAGTVKRNTVNTPPRTAGRSTGTYQTAGRNPQTGTRTATREIRRGKRNILWLVMLFIVVSVVPTVIEEVRERTGSMYQEVQDEFEEDSSWEKDPELTLTVDDTLVIGEDLEAGHYIFTVTGGYVDIQVERHGDSSMYGLGQGSKRTIDLLDEDRVWIKSATSQTAEEDVEVQVWGVGTD